MQKLSKNELVKRGYSEKSIKEYNNWFNKKESVKKTAPKIQAKKIVARKNKYRNYLDSVEWANIKLDLYQTRGKQCEICGSKSNIQVHHKTYKNIFKEEPKDLILLCKRCHSKQHSA